MTSSNSSKLTSILRNNLGNNSDNVRDNDNALLLGVRDNFVRTRFAEANSSSSDDDDDDDDVSMLLLFVVVICCWNANDTSC